MNQVRSSQHYCGFVATMLMTAMLLNGCIIRQTVREPRPSRQAEFEKLKKRRDDARSGRTLSAVGLAGAKVDRG